MELHFLFGDDVGGERVEDGLKSFLYSSILNFHKVQKYEQAVISIIETYNQDIEGVSP